MLNQTDFRTMFPNHKTEPVWIVLKDGTIGQIFGFPSTGILLHEVKKVNGDEIVLAPLSLRDYSEFEAEITREQIQADDMGFPIVVVEQSDNVKHNGKVFSFSVQRLAMYLELRKCGYVAINCWEIAMKDRDEWSVLDGLVRYSHKQTSETFDPECKYMLVCL